MSEPYIVRRDGVDYHAPDLETLRQWAREGRVLPTDLVYAPTFQAWYRAYDLRGLRDVLPRGGAAPPPTAQQSQQFFWLRKGEDNYRADDLETILRWAEEGNIGPDDFIFHPGYGKWFRAGDSPQLVSRFPPHIARQPPFLPASADPMRGGGQPAGGVRDVERPRTGSMPRVGGGRPGTVEAADSMAKTVMDFRAADVIRALEAEQRGAPAPAPGPDPKPAETRPGPAFSRRREGTTLEGRPMPDPLRATTPPASATARRAPSTPAAASPRPGPQPDAPAAESRRPAARSVPGMAGAPTRRAGPGSAAARPSAPAEGTDRGGPATARRASPAAADAAAPAGEDLLGATRGDAARAAPEAAKKAPGEGRSAARTEPEVAKKAPGEGSSGARTEPESAKKAPGEGSSGARTVKGGGEAPAVPGETGGAAGREGTRRAPEGRPGEGRPDEASADGEGSEAGGGVTPDSEERAAGAEPAAKGVATPAAPTGDGAGRAPGEDPSTGAGDRASSGPPAEVKYVDRLGLMKLFYDVARVFLVTRDLRPGEALETSCRIGGMDGDFLGMTKRAIYHRLEEAMRAHLDGEVRPARERLRPDEVPGYERMVERATALVEVFGEVREVIGQKPPERVVIGNRARPKMTPEEEAALQRIDGALKALISVRARPAPDRAA